MTDLSADPSPPLAPAEPRGGYDPGFFQLLDDVEDRHFWFRARARVIGALVRRATAGLADGYRVLEVGCGNGGVLRVLRRECPTGRVYGMDLYQEGLVRAARRSGCPLVRGDVRASPFVTPFEAIGMFDVLEHLEDDVAILKHVRSLLTPGGALLLTVPAHPSLWSYFDTASRHCRRYTPASLAAALSAAGFRVEYRSQFMAALFPLVWAGRRAAAWKARLSGGGAADPKALSSSELRVVPGVNGALVRLLSIESAWIGLGGRLPIGTSLAVIARPQGP